MTILETTLGDASAMRSSSAQPAITLVVMDESAALLQAGIAQKLLNQLSIDRRVMSPEMRTLMTADGLKHAAAPGFAAMVANVLLQSVESMKTDWGDPAKRD